MSVFPPYNFPVYNPSIRFGILTNCLHPFVVRYYPAVIFAEPFAFGDDHRQFFFVCFIRCYPGLFGQLSFVVYPLLFGCARCIGVFTAHPGLKLIIRGIPTGCV